MRSFLLIASIALAQAPWVASQDIWDIVSSYIAVMTGVLLLIRVWLSETVADDLGSRQIVHKCQPIDSHHFRYQGFDWRCRHRG